MKFNVVDIIVIILLIIGFLKGFKRGVVKQTVMTVGSILVIVLAFTLKNPLSKVLYTKLPFFTTGILKNYSILNIFLYELISFLILLTIFSLIYAIIVKISGLVEKLLRGTVILALPSKILGGILGVVETYLACFIILLIITLPIFTISNSKVIRESKTKDIILSKTLVVSKLSKGITTSVNEINDLLKDKKKLGTEEFNCKALKVFIKNNIVTKDSAEYLKKKNKINKTCTLK